MKHYSSQIASLVLGEEFHLTTICFRANVRVILICLWMYEFLINKQNLIGFVKWFLEMHFIEIQVQVWYFWSIQNCAARLFSFKCVSNVTLYEQMHSVLSKYDVWQPARYILYIFSLSVLVKMHTLIQNSINWSFICISTLVETFIKCIYNGFLKSSHQFYVKINQQMGTLIMTHWKWNICHIHNVC